MSPCRSIWKSTLGRFGLIVLAFVSHMTLAMAADKNFSIATEEYPPFVGNALPNMGWTMAVARAILEPQGYAVRLTLLPWVRALEDTKAGKYDGLYLAFHTAERERWFMFSDPIGETRTGFYKLRKREIRYRDLRSLEAYTIGLTRGAAVSDDFDNADYLRKEYSDSDELVLRKLLHGRIDLFAGNELVARHTILTKFPTEVHGRFEFVEPPLTIQKLHMAISKRRADYGRKLVDFNRGLGRILDDGTYQRIRRQFGMITSAER